MSRARIRADEQVGPLEQRGRLGDRQAAGPVAQPVVRLEDARKRKRPRSRRRPRPASHSSRNRSIRTFHDRVGQRLAAFPAPRCTARSGGSDENRSACSQSASSAIDSVDGGR